MADDTPIILLGDIAEICRENGYVVEEIDNGLEISGSDEGGAFYLFPQNGWLQVRCQVLDSEDLDRARALDALFETIARAQFRLIGSRFGFDPHTGLWLIQDMYPGFEADRLPAVLEQLAFVWSALESVLENALGGVVADDDAMNAAFDLELSAAPN
jgi:hypothetical protein